MAEKLLIVGSSNIRNIFKHRLDSIGSQLGIEAKYVPASHYESGCDALETLEQGQIAVVGFVMNGIVDAMRNKNVDEAEVEAKRMVIEYTEKLKSVDSQIRLYIMPPFPRAKIEWTKQQLPGIHETLKVGLAGADNIKVLQYLDVADNDFVNDGIHLNPDMCAKQFAQVVGELKVLLKARLGKRTTEWSEDITPASKKSIKGFEENADTAGTSSSKWPATASTSGFQARGRGRGKGRDDQAGRGWRSEDRSGSSLEAKVDGLAQDVQSLMFESLATC